MAYNESHFNIYPLVTKLKEMRENTLQQCTNAVTNLLRNRSKSATQALMYIMHLIHAALQKDHW